MSVPIIAAMARAVVVLAVLASVRAATFTARRSGDLSDPDTWVGGMVPSDGDTIIFNSCEVTLLHGTVASLTRQMVMGAL
jgi:hypothetical protein